MSETRLYQLVRIYLKNNYAKFDLDLIWHNAALGFLWRRLPQQEEQEQ